jgi:hypothetical protein
MVPCSESSELKEKSDRRIAFMADRMAVMLCILKSRHESWDWLYGEAMWEDEEGMAAELRDWPEYKIAKEIVRLWIKKHDSREREYAKAAALD